MKKTILAAILILLPSLALAQQLTDLKDKPYISKNATSLFDPSRLKIRQSYSIGYYSGNGGSGSIGYYLNSIEYSFSNPLKIRVDLGFLHNPSSILSGRSSISKSGTIIPGVSVDWRPSSAFHFRLDVRQVPVYNNGYYNSYYNPNYWEDFH
jgi:hypothetical protein